MFSVTLSYLSVNGFRIYWYGVLIALGAALALILACRREQRFGFKKDTMVDAALICLPLGIVGARVYYVLMKPGEFDSLAAVLDLRSGGLAIFGGLIFGLSAAYIFARVRRLSFISLFDCVAPAIALAQSIGRWGNFLNSEAYGVQILDTRLQFFPLAVYISAECGWFAATFFYESVWCLLTAVYILRRNDLEKGRAALTYVCMYCAERCVVEGLRTDSLYLGSFRVSQVLSAALLISACAYLCVKHRKPLPCALAFCGSALIIAGILTQFLPLTLTGSMLMLVTALRLIPGA